MRQHAKLAYTLAITFALIAAKTVLQDTPKFRYLEDKTYESLERRIATGGTITRPDVLIVDLGKIKPQSWERNGRKGFATPRTPIKKLIEVFTDLGARSVAVDVDFSPKNDQPIHPEDPEFFQWCLDRSKQMGVPIVLGVFRTAREPSEWLGDDRYMRLAAFMGVGNPDRAVYWIWSKNGFPLRGMSAGMAGISLESLLRESHSFWNWIVKPTSIIDLSRLNRIREEAFHTVNPEFFRDERDKIEHRMILIGDTDEKDCGDDPSLWTKRDCFHLTGVDGPVRGVFLHACGAATIAANKPIYQLTLVGGILADVFLALLIIVAVNTSLWMRSLFKQPQGHVEWALDAVFTFLAVLFVFVVSFILVRSIRLLWIDFLFACGVLLFQLLIDTGRHWKVFPR